MRSVWRGLGLALLVCVLALSAVGLVLLPHVESDSICGSYSGGSDISLWPPGYSCVTESGRVVEEKHDVAGFFAALGAGLALAIAVARSGPCPPGWLRGAVSGALTVGMIALFVLWIPAFVVIWFPAFLSLPVAWFVEWRLAGTDRGALRAVRGVLLAGLSFVFLAFWLLFGIGLAAPLVAVLAAAALGHLTERPKRLPSPA